MIRRINEQYLFFFLAIILGEVKLMKLEVNNLKKSYGEMDPVLPLKGLIQELFHRNSSGSLGVGTACRQWLCGQSAQQPLVALVLDPPLRWSVLQKPLPSNLMPLAENVLDAGAPQLGHTTSGVSDMGCSTSKTLPQLVHLYSQRAIILPFQHKAGRSLCPQ